MEAIDHYRRNEEAYQRIATALNSVRKQFESADRTTQRTMLMDASTYAVMSVQNSVEMLRRGFTAYAEADDWEDVKDGCKALNYGKNKFRYITENHQTIQELDEPIDLLEAGRTHEAVDVIVDELLGVSYVKAAFTVAMLGFTDTLCVDTNVAQAMSGDVNASDYKSLDEYTDAVDAVLDRFDGLSDRLDPFLVQWALFDWFREDGVTYHEEYFEHMLPGTPFGRQLGLNDF